MEKVDFLRGFIFLEDLKGKVDFLRRFKGRKVDFLRWFEGKKLDDWKEQVGFLGWFKGTS